MERIQKILSARGVASRRAAESMIEQGRVTVNGRTARLGESADATKDCILIDGKPLPQPAARVCVMLYKPRGYVTTMCDERGRKTAASLVDCGTRVYPIGRLDLDSEGLLLLTNDGALADRLMRPSSQIEKEYEVTVSGTLSCADERLRRPIILDGRPIHAPNVELLWENARKACYRITICEGRNRQIRRMCEAAGLEVLRLRRVREGGVSLGALEVGKWRYLTAQELACLEGEENAT